MLWWQTHCRAGHTLLLTTANNSVIDAQGLSSRLLDAAWFYSDSINDLPLLSSVGHPVAVNPDALLQRHALANGWRVIDVLGDVAA
ncbi:hypothetical protein [Hydrogenophaga sp.]|uniref:HAD family hydrolase n=1 Tax=Hydrogenophaga sp. TaxID=1904254 RepID=UPI0026296009|nr:hypothetical protein [Hydrogenophaga sp.]MCW5655363.1 hypothetical protein [Hydrogenophaga sp.]